MNDSRGFQLADGSWSNYYTEGDTFTSIDPLAEHLKLKLTEDDKTSCPYFTTCEGDSLCLPWSVLKTTYTFPLGASVVIVNGGALTWKYGTMRFKEGTKFTIYDYTRFQGEDKVVVKDEEGYVLMLDESLLKLEEN